MIPVTPVMIVKTTALLSKSQHFEEAEPRQLLTFAFSFHTKVPVSIVAVQTNTQIPAIIATVAHMRKKTGSCQMYMRAREGVIRPPIFFVWPLMSIRIRRGAFR